MAKPKYRVRVDWNHGGLGDQNTAMDFTTAIDDITSDVRSLSFDHRRDLSKEVIEAGILSLELNNTDNKYSPTNLTDNTLAPGDPAATLVLPGKPIWVQMFYPYDSFTGSQANLDTHTPDEDSAWSWVDGTYEFELDGSGNARITNATSGSQGVGARYSYLEFGDKNVHLHARITTPAGYAVSSDNDLVSFFGLVVRWTDANNYQAVGFDCSNTGLASIEAKVALLTYSTNRTVTGNNSTSTTDYTCPDSSLYKVNNYVLIEHELHQVTAIVDGTTIRTSRGAFRTDAVNHGTGSLVAPIVQFAPLAKRNADTAPEWGLSETHDIGVLCRDEYIDVTFDGTHCPPGTVTLNYQVGDAGGIDPSADGLEPVTSHTFTAEAGASTGTKHGLWRHDRAKEDSDHGGSAGVFDSVELYEEFGGYLSLFFGYISSITPDPDPQNQYCYIEAYDEFESAKRAHIRYATLQHGQALNRKDFHYPLIALMAHGKQFVYGWTAYTNHRGFNIIAEPFIGVTGPASSVQVNSFTALKRVDDTLLNIMWKAQIEEDGFFYVDGEGFLRLESRVHRTGAGTGHTPSTWSPLLSTGADHSATHDSLTSHTHVLYGRDANGTYKDTYDGTNPAYALIDYEDGHQYIENRLAMAVQASERSVTTGVKIWNSSQADGVESILVAASSAITIIADLGRDYDTAATVTLPTVTNGYLAAYPNQDGSGTAATNSEIVAAAVTGLGDPNYSAFKFTITNTTGSALYVTKFDLYTPASGATAGGFKLGNKIVVEALDATSITAYGERRVELKNLFLTNTETAQLALDARLARKKDPKTILKLTLYGGDKATLHHMIQRRLSDRVKVTNSNMARTNKEFYVEGEKWDIEEGGTLIEQQLLLRAV